MPGGDGGSDRIFDLLVAVLAIPGLHGVSANDGSDAHAFFDHRILAVLIGTPTRYTHTATVDLLRAFVTTSSPAE